ncbi:Prophage PssSM-02, Orf30 [Pseudomonas cannabina]|uniref:Prophage PssSM-02, Orf30 n=1 Tax=Pseudomonas cannabina TaxID=86840 RepID=A0A3M3KDK0_PSECA|nr:Prophage PssSM-02, Orf30 [Pseudomonas cannabina]
MELLRIVERLSLAGNEPDAQAILKMIILFQADEDKLAGYVDEVRAGRIVRERSE